MATGDMSGCQVDVGWGTCAVRKARLRRRMYQLSAKKIERARTERLIAIPAFAPSESWEDGRAGGMAVGVDDGDGEERTLDVGGDEGAGNDGLGVVVLCETPLLLRGIGG
jgi:hypothetical protein